MKVIGQWRLHTHHSAALLLIGKKTTVLGVKSRVLTEDSIEILMQRGWCDSSATPSSPPVPMTVTCGDEDRREL